MYADPLRHLRSPDTTQMLRWTDGSFLCMRPVFGEISPQGHVFMSVLFVDTVHNVRSQPYTKSAEPQDC